MKFATIFVGLVLIILIILSILDFLIPAVGAGLGVILAATFFMFRETKETLS